MTPTTNPPATVAAVVTLESEVLGPSAFASPKSSTLIVSLGVTMMFAGFRSRWMMVAVGDGERLGDPGRDADRWSKATGPFLSFSSRVSPSTSSITMQVDPSTCSRP